MNTANAAPVLELRDVEIRYGGNVVVSHASFSVAEGEFLTLLGPSGSGKTSLLRTIAGFVRASAGSVLLRGTSVENVPAYERDVGMVFQNYALFPHMTIEENLAFGPRMMKIDRREIAGRIDDALAQVRLQKFAGRYPHQLSGGQQQRVAIARALVLRPSLLLLDEPMSNLDARLRAEMRVELVSLLKNLGMTAVAVTHNQEEALAMSDRIVVMAEGAIRQVGSPAEIYLQPADPFVANFVGDANVIPVDYVGKNDEGDSMYRISSGDVLTARGNSAECRQANRLLLRPESIGVAPAPAGPQPGQGNRLTGVLASTAYMGAYTELRARLGTQEILVKLPAGPQAHDMVVGDKVLLTYDANAARPLSA